MAAGGGATTGTTTRRKRRKNAKTKYKSKKINICSVKLEPEEPHFQIHHPDSGEDVSNLVPQLITAAHGALSFLRRHDLHLLPSQSLSLENLLASTSTSFPKLLSLLSFSPQSIPPPPPVAPPPPQPCWFDRFLSSADDDHDSRWAHFFNLSKPSFTLLLRLLTPSLTSLSPLLPLNFALAATLLRLAHAASFSAVSRRFNIDPATACRAFYTVCKAINERLGHLFELKSDINRIVVGFGWISLPNCCGVLGFEKFRLDGSLLGKEEFLIAQALVDSEGRFLDVSAGWPSNVSPENILRKSKLFAGIEESKEYLNGPSFEISDRNSIPQYILGESCFPIMPWLLTPYRDFDEHQELNSSKTAFNKVHEVGVQLVRKAFWKLRKRWKLVTEKWNEECIEAFPFIIVACCLLQNFLIKCSEPVQVQVEDVDFSRDEEFPVFDGDGDETGQKIRDALASHLNRVNQRR
ncbi:OLC1v1038112C1 [Oldenlandia corymbosa var. corymbosa]|uniref:OLC1v1038112C1 n=1 Tax=Oldenlandia corymbosa var. corymbosa TaxID=529605 RepID=A0AAV1D1B1_OLDCO|nr:OLC1v1038112C1 [Oldenlandia corymbosa var. corymbosa]